MPHKPPLLTAWEAVFYLIFSNAFYHISRQTKSTATYDASLRTNPPRYVSRPIRRGALPTPCVSYNYKDDQRKSKELLNCNIHALPPNLQGGGPLAFVLVITSYAHLLWLCRSFFSRKKNLPIDSSKVLSHHFYLQF